MSLTRKHFLDSENDRPRGRFESIEHELRRAQARHDREVNGDEDSEEGESQYSQPSQTQARQSPERHTSRDESSRQLSSSNVIYESPKR